MSTPRGAGESRRDDRDAGALIAATADGLLAAFVAAVAAWTLCYHAALILDLSVDATLVAWAVLLAVAGAAATRIGASRRAGDARTRERDAHEHRRRRSGRQSE